MRSGGHDHFLHLTVSQPAEHGEERHREQLAALRAGFILVLPHDDDKPKKPGALNPAEESRVDADAENLTFEISGLETTDAKAPSYHVAYALLQTLPRGKVDTWKAIIGGPPPGQIRVRAGIAILSSKSQSIRRAAGQIAGPLRATYLYVRSDSTSCTYTFAGSFRRQP